MDTCLSPHAMRGCGVGHMKDSSDNVYLNLQPSSGTLATVNRGPETGASRTEPSAFRRSSTSTELTSVADSCT